MAEEVVDEDGGHLGLFVADRLLDKLGDKLSIDKLHNLFADWILDDKAVDQFVLMDEHFDWFVVDLRV